MKIRRVRNEEADLYRYIKKCWLPYHKDLSDIVATHSLIDDLDIQEVVEFHLDRLDSPSTRLWVALDDVDVPMKSLSEVDATFAGFVLTRFDPSPQEALP